MFPNILIWVSVLLVVASASPLPKNNQNLSEPIRPQLRMVVSVEGKSFFAEATPARTWDEANSYCVSLGMRLASISTSQQYTALRNAYDANNFHGEFWTSAKSVNALTQFGWDSGTGGQPENFLNYHPVYNDLEYNGLSILIESDKQGTLYGNKVSRTWGTLCETYEEDDTKVEK